MAIKVVNKRNHQATSEDYYIGRGSPLGNPFTGTKKIENTKAEFQVNSRKEAIEKYSEWLDERIKSKDVHVRNSLNEIYLMAKAGNVNLVCYCAPKACHGDIIKRIIEMTLNKNSASKKGFVLSKDKTGKDQGKANYANAYIGFGIERNNGMSSTGIYLQDAIKQGIPVNEKIKPDKDTVAFVSVSSEGKYVPETVALAKEVLQAGGKVIMDREGTNFGESHSSFNRKGEGAVHDQLGPPNRKTKEGYAVWDGMEQKLVKKKVKSKGVSM